MHRALRLPSRLFIPRAISRWSLFLGLLLTPALAWALPAAVASRRLASDFWRTLGVGIVVVATAALIGRFVPERRGRLRSLVTVYVLYVLATVVHAVFFIAGWHDRATEAGWVVELVETCAIANVTVILVFHIVLRAVRYEPAVIVSEITTGAAYGLAFLHELHQAGLNLSGVIATSAVASAVLGISLAPTLGNILGGVALQLDDSIHEGDWVQLDVNTQGRVKAVRWRHTVVETRNWDTIIVPNSSLLMGSIMLLGKRTGAPVQRRYWVFFNVDYRTPPWEVVSLVDEALRSSPVFNVAIDPQPNTICWDLGKDLHAGYAQYAARFWLIDLALDDPTLSAVRQRIYAALQRAGIALPLPATAMFVTHDNPEHQSRKDAREQIRRVALLRKIDLFGDFSDTELDKLAQGLKHAPFAVGDLMTVQGRLAHWLYILADGVAEVRVTVDSGTGSNRVREIHAPGFFGEMGLMTGAVRTASVVALTPCDCYLLDKDTFQGFLRQRPELAAVVSLVLARRKAELDAVREGLTEEQKGARVNVEHARLLMQIERFFGLRDAQGH